MLVTYQRELSYLLMLQALREPVHCIQIGNETFLYLVELSEDDIVTGVDNLNKLIHNHQDTLPVAARYDSPARPLGALLISKKDDIGIGHCAKVSADAYVSWAKKADIKRVQKIFKLLLQFLELSGDEKFDTYKERLTDAITAADIFEPKEIISS